MNTVFEKIYKKNYWGGDHSRSGRGSDSDQTIEIIKKLPSVLKKYKIKSIVDASCGDFNWMNKVLSSVSFESYFGIDIVEELIAQNQEKYGSSKISFLSGDISLIKIPKSDLILCRDALVHLPFKTIYKTLENFIKSGSKYLLVTHFIKTKSNRDIKVADWRALNLTKEPFLLPDPLEIILEKTTVDEGIYSQDKTLSLWELKSVNLPPVEVFLEKNIDMLLNQLYKTE